MANPYTQPTEGSYNANPPSDDGSETAANRVDWSTIKEKLSDVVRQFAQDMDSNVLTAFGKRFLNNINSQTSTYSVQSSDEGKLIVASNTITIKCPAASAANVGFAFVVLNDGSGTVTIAIADSPGTDTIDGLTSLTANNAAIVVGITSTKWYCLPITQTAANDSIGSDQLVDANDPLGVQTITIPASAMYASTTNGAAFNSVELGTNDVEVSTMDFDAATQEFAQFAIAMPKGWNEGTLTYDVGWSHADGATFTVVWELQATAISNDDAMDASWGTAVEVSDTGGTNDDLYITPTSSALTVGGTPAESDMVQFRIARDPANGSDGHTTDARLHWVRVFYTIDAASDD